MSSCTFKYDVAVLGAGAAGLFCAWEAARRGLRVALIDRQGKVGRKLGMAGGGWGNVTNRTLTEAHYVGESTLPCRSVLKRFTTADALAMLHELGIPWEERDFGQIFCLRPAVELAEALARKGREAGLDFFLGHEVEHVEAEAASEPENRFSLRVGEAEIRSACLVLATGGPSYPHIGASDFGARLARRWGHRVIPFRPVLTPFVMPSDWHLHGLEGISLNARLVVRSADKGTGKSVDKSDPCGARSLLFTHRGVSGPAALVASCFWHPSDALVMDFLPETPVLELFNEPGNGKLLARNLLARHLPSRLAERLCPEDLARRKTAELGKSDRSRLAEAVHLHTVTPAGVEGMRKAEAAAGGVAFEDVGRNLESRLLPGLFFCGELLDIAGLLGGYNIHWALASARMVAESVAAKNMRKVPGNA